VAAEYIWPVTYNQQASGSGILSAVGAAAEAVRLPSCLKILRPLLSRCFNRRSVLRQAGAAEKGRASNNCGRIY